MRSINFLVLHLTQIKTLLIDIGIVVNGHNYLQVLLLILCSWSSWKL